MHLDSLTGDPQLACTLTTEQAVAALAEIHVAQARLTNIEGALVTRLLALQAQPEPTEDVLLDMRAVARLLGIPESRARELGRRGQLRTVQVGKYVRVSRRALEAFLAGVPPPIDARPYAAYSRGDGRRGVPAASKVRTADAAGARGSARRHGEHSRPVGAQRDAYHGADGAADRPYAQDEQARPE